MIIDLLKFLLYAVFSYLIPGYLFASRIKNTSLTVKVFLSLALGFSLSALIGNIANWLYYLFIGVSLIIFIATKKYLDFTSVKKPKIDKISILIIAVIVLGVLFQNNLTFRSGLNYSFGIGYWGALSHDGVWHHALINQLVKAVPPQNPGFSGVLLTNYHYFYDLLVAINTKITGIDIPDLIYRYYPLIFSVLMGVGTYLLAVLLFKKRLIGVIALYLAYFGSSFGWIIDWIKGRELAGESAFWANQPVSFNINPPFAISLILLIAFLIGFKLFSDKKNWWLAALLIIVGGTIIEFKVYGGLILLISLMAVVLKKLLFDRDYRYLAILIGATAIALYVFLPGGSNAGGFVVFTPFWIIDSMVDIVDRVGWPRLSLARTVGLATKNWPKFFAAQVIGLFLFIVGNLGTRILALGALFIVPIKKWWQDNTLLLIFVMLFASVLPTLLFVQKGDPWNIIQFTYYFIYLTIIFAAVVIYRLVINTPKVIGVIIISALTIITPISSVWTFRSGFNGQASYIDKGEIDALNFLKSMPNGIVLTYPYNDYLRYSIKNPTPLPLWAYQTSAYVSAYSNKVTYLEDLMQQGILGNKFAERQLLSEKYFGQRLTPKEAKSFLKEYDISYIYVPKALSPLVNVKPAATIIFENDSAIIYEADKI